MNWLLITILDVVNKLLALFIIVSSTLSGYVDQFRAYLGPDYTGEPYRILGAIFGFIAGVIAAGIVSGLIAAVITISREMTAMRILLETRAPPPRQAGF
jgi:hypothetical protein